MSQSNARSGTIISGSTAVATTSGRVVLANGASTTVTHAADANNMRRAKFYEYVVTGSTDNATLFQSDCEGSNGATSYTEQSVYMRSVTFAASAVISTAQFKHGASSFYAPGGVGGAGVTLANTNLAFSGDYTIEFWFRHASRPSSGQYQHLLDWRPASTEGWYPLLAVDSAGILYYFVNSSFRITAGAAISTNTWYHIAVCRSGSSTKLFIDGVQTGSTWTDSTSLLCSIARFGGHAYVGGNSVNGYYDGMRVENTARYTANFTAPGVLSLPTYTVTYKPRAESVVTILHDNGAGANRSTQTTATNASGGTLQGELIVIQ
jgi:hypothetical protein